MPLHYKYILDQTELLASLLLQLKYAEFNINTIAGYNSIAIQRVQLILQFYIKHSKIIIYKPLFDDIILYSVILSNLMHLSTIISHVRE